MQQGKPKKFILSILPEFSQRMRSNNVKGLQKDVTKHKPQKSNPFNEAFVL